MSKQLLKTMLFMLAIAATTIAPAMGQTTLAGTGTATNPYLISSAADWDAFAASVNGGNPYQGQQAWSVTAAEGATVAPAGNPTATYTGTRKVKSVKAVKAETPQP